MMGVENFTGREFGRLTVIEGAGYNNHHVYTWKCRCACGNIKVITSANLRGKTRSCGCLKRELFISRIHRHGKSHTPEYRTWQSMVARCCDPNNAAYAGYGGRGIQVCERWKSSLNNFISDMGLRPSDDHSLDRINNDGNYEPNNCRWATQTEQNNNKSTNVLVELNGETMTIAQAARMAGVVDPQRAASRLRRGWPLEEAIGMDYVENTEPEFFGAVSFSVEETILGLNVLTAKVRSLKHSHATKNAAAMKLDAEAVAKLSGQIKLLTDHLASVCCRHLNRRSRV